jgi:hypothetical protein
MFMQKLKGLKGPKGRKGRKGHKPEAQAKVLRLRFRLVSFASVAPRSQTPFGNQSEARDLVCTFASLHANVQYLHGFPCTAGFALQKHASKPNSGVQLV